MNVKKSRNKRSYNITANAFVWCDGEAWLRITRDQPLAVQIITHQLLVIGIEFVGKLYGIDLF
jgi:hypothetical protein